MTGRNNPMLRQPDKHLAAASAVNGHDHALVTTQTAVMTSSCAKTNDTRRATLSGMPPTYSPTITLLQKQREMVATGAESRRRAVTLTPQEVSGTSSHGPSAVDALFDALQTVSDRAARPVRNGHRLSRQDKLVQCDVVEDRNASHQHNLMQHGVNQRSISGTSTGDCEKIQHRVSTAADRRRYSGNDFYQQSVSGHDWRSYQIANGGNKATVSSYNSSSSSNNNNNRPESNANNSISAPAHQTQKPRRQQRHVSPGATYDGSDRRAAEAAAGDNNMFYERRQQNTGAFGERFNQHSISTNVDDDDDEITTTISCNENAVRILPLKQWQPPSASYRQKRYDNVPMKIEDYEPGASSLALQEPSLNHWHNPPVDKPGDFCKYVDLSTDLRYRIRKKQRSLSPSPLTATTAYLSDSSVHDQYKKVQKGGDIPLNGLRCPTPPPRSKKRATAATHPSVEKESAVVDKFLNSNSELKLSLDENEDDDLKRGQSATSTRQDQLMSAASTLSEMAAMGSVGLPLSSLNAANERQLLNEMNAARKLELELILAEERRKRLEHEARVNLARRHSACFVLPSRCAPVALDRYSGDEFDQMSLSLPRQSPGVASSKSARLRAKARALYAFHAQSNRELSLRQNDIVYLNRIVDENWFEGEHHGLVGIFPKNYVEVLISIDEANATNRQQQQQQNSRQVRVAYDFVGQTAIELSLHKGDIVTVLRQLDANWYEGRIANRQGLFPVSYVEPITVTPSSSSSVSTLTAISSGTSFERQMDAQTMARLGSSGIPTPPSSRTSTLLSGKTGRLSRPNSFVASNEAELPTAGFSDSGPTVPTSLPEQHKYSAPAAAAAAASSSSHNHSRQTQRTMTSSRSFDSQADVPLQSHSDLRQRPRSAERYSLTERTHVRSADSSRLRSNDQESPNEKDDVRLDDNDDDVRRQNNVVTDSMESRWQPKQRSSYHRSSSDELTDITTLPESENLATSANDEQFAPTMTTSKDDRNGDVGQTATEPDKSVRQTSRLLQDQGLGVIKYSPYYAVYPYAPCDEDELTLSPGDIVYVTETFEDGWMIGISQRTNEYGSFPSTCVSQLRVRPTTRHPPSNNSSGGGGGSSFARTNRHQALSSSPVLYI